MKSRLLLFILLLCVQITTHASDLVEVFQQALMSDPIYQQAIAERLSTKKAGTLIFQLCYPIYPSQPIQLFLDLHFQEIITIPMWLVFHLRLATILILLIPLR